MPTVTYSIDKKLPHTALRCSDGCVVAIPADKTSKQFLKRLVAQANKEPQDKGDLRYKIVITLPRMLIASSDDTFIALLAGEKIAAFFMKLVTQANET